MKTCVLSLVAAAVLCGCGAVPFRYEGPDAATIVGAYGANKSMIVEVNGERRQAPYAPGAIKVKPGLLTVGLNLWNISGQLYGFGCFEIDAPPGSHHEFSAKVADGGFDVSLYEGLGQSKKLIDKAFVPFVRPMDRRCPVRPAQKS